MIQVYEGGGHDPNDVYLVAMRWEHQEEWSYLTIPKPAFMKNGTVDPYHDDRWGTKDEARTIPREEAEEYLRRLKAQPQNAELVSTFECRLERSSKHQRMPDEALRILMAPDPGEP